METTIKVKEKQIGESVITEIRFIFIQVTLNTNVIVDYGLFTSEGYILKKNLIRIEGEDYKKWNEDTFLEDYVLKLEELERL